MTIILLDYDKAPPGYAIEEDAADPPSGKHGSYLRDADDKETLWESDWTTWAGACAAAWTHVRANNDPLGVMHCGPLGLYVAFGPGLTKTITLTDSECEEVERYAALPFPRSVDMPAPLQYILLAEDDRTC